MTNVEIGNADTRLRPEPRARAGGRVAAPGPGGFHLLTWDLLFFIEELMTTSYGCFVVIVALRESATAADFARVNSFVTRDAIKLCF